MTNLVIDIAPETSGTALGEITADFFGGILINQNDFYDYMEDYEQLGLTYVRYPGGTIAEVGIIIDGSIKFAPEPITYDEMITDRSNLAYDLSFPELTNPDLLAADDANGDQNSYGSLSEIMEFCIENDAALSIILPTTRYFTGLDLTDPSQMEAMRSLIVSDVTIFLDRIKNGEYNNGELPKNIIFEIGNEVYSSPIEYAVVSQIYLSTINALMGQSNIDYQIAFQMNVGSAQFQELYDQDYFDHYFDETGSPLIPQLEGFTFDLDQSYGLSERTTLIEQMMAHILGGDILSIDLLRHHYLGADANTLSDSGAVLNQRDDILLFWLNEIALHGGSPDDVGYYVSAWTTDSSNTGDGPSGLSAATNTLVLFTHFLDLEVDLAAAWGINGSIAYWPSNSPTTVLTFSGQDGTTPGGAILGMMAEDVIGLTHLESTIDMVLEVDNPTDYLEFIYTSEQKTVLFYSVGALDGKALTINVDLWRFGFFSHAEIQNLGTDNGTEFGLASIESSSQDLMNNVVQITFDQSYEVVKIVLEIAGIQGTANSDTMTGTAGEDVIYGHGGSDVLNGWDGSDTILGGSGKDGLYGNSGDDFLFGEADDDKLFGGNGDDWLYGGDGSDALYGGSGKDVLAGGAGSDILYGGDGDDILHADWSGINGDRPTGHFNGKVESAGGTDEWTRGINDLFAGSTLSGGAGDDTLIGGKGADVFVFETGNDVIKGFQVGLDVLAINIPGVDQYDLASLVSDLTDKGLLLDFENGNSVLLQDVFTLINPSDGLALYG
jgi:Ca2+-binding RTX toxin-like protein